MGGAFCTLRGELKKYFNGGLAFITGNAFGGGAVAGVIFFSSVCDCGWNNFKRKFQVVPGYFTGTTRIYVVKIVYNFFFSNFK